MTNTNSTTKKDIKDIEETQMNEEIPPAIPFKKLKQKQPKANIGFHPIEVHCINSLGSNERLKRKIVESQLQNSIRVNWSAII